MDKMKTYTYGASHTVLAESFKAKVKSNFSMLNYQLDIARKMYPNMIIKEVKYQRIKNGIEDPTGKKVDEHKWTIILETIEELMR